MAGISITLGGNFSVLNALQAKATETAAKIRNGFAERIGHRMFDGLLASAESVAREIPAAIKLSVDAASDLGETVSKVTVIFGESTDAILDWSTTSADAFGLSRQQALAAAADFGGMFRVMGLGKDQVDSMSTNLVGLAADLASFSNTPVPDALQAIGSALRGESEPIRRYNVLLDDATLKAAAMAKGLHDGKGSLDPMTRALAAYEVILTQTKDAQGDFARTSDGLANSQRIVAARFADLTAEIGESFLPMAEEFANWLKTVDFQPAANGVRLLVDAMSALVDVFLVAQQFNDKLLAGTPLGVAKSAMQSGVAGGKKDSAGPTEDETTRAAAQVAAEARVVADAAKAKAAQEAEKANAAFQQQLQSIQSGMLSVLDAEQARMAAVSAHEAELALIVAKTAGDEKRVTLLEREAAILAKIGELTAAGVDDKDARARAEALADANEELKLAERRREKEQQIAEARKAAGFGDPGSETIADLMSKLTSARSEFDGGSYRSSLTVDSMQRIGGGGGFSGSDGMLDYQRRQTDHLREVVATLRAIEDKVGAKPLD